MRHLQKLTFLAIAMIFCSCSQEYYHQLYEVETESINNKGLSENIFSFDQDSLTVTYNFWGRKGNLFFIVENHSNDYVHINLKESYFTLNGWAHNYYDQATYSISRTASEEVNEAASIPDRINPEQRNTVVIGKGASKEIQTSFKEMKEIGIPPQSKKQFFKFNLKNDVYSNPDLALHPKSSDSLTFSENSTPLRFKNIIHYSFKSSEKPSGYIEHEFWTKEITNVKGTAGSRSAPNKFYLSYQEGYSGNILPVLGFLAAFGVALIFV